MSISKILKHVKISGATLYSYLRHQGVEVGSFTKSKKQPHTHKILNREEKEAIKTSIASG